MLAFLLVTGRFRFKNGGMPIAGSCSAAISAACHSTGESNEIPLPAFEEAEEGGLLEVGGLEAAFRPLRWGDMGVYSELAEDLAGEEVDASLVKRRRVGHCGFSSQKVGVPGEGELYAGSQHKG